MLQSLKKLYGQSVLAASGRCGLSCLGCDIWNRPPKEAVIVDKTICQEIKAGTYRVQSRWTNITGGDPFLNPYLPTILKTIKAQGGKVRLWTHGQATVDFWEVIHPFCDEVVFYVPFSEAEDYRDFTGSDGFNTVLEAIQQHRIKFRVRIGFRITPENIDWLPEIYELAYQKNLPLWLFFNPKAAFTGDSKAFINRYYRIKNVSVFKDTYTVKGLCYGFGTGVLSSWQHFKNGFKKVF